jgi:capsular polysaccharide transport system permease protein
MSASEVGAIRGSTSARQLRRVRARRLLRRFLIWCGGPTLLAIIYFGFWAAPQYESVAVFTVQSNQGSAGALDGLAALLPTASTSPRDAKMVRQYATSRTMLNHLIDDHRFVELYRDAGADFWSRLDADASPEELYEFFADKIKVAHASDGSTLTLTVRAFSPEAAHDLNQAILKASEKMLNEMTERGRNDRIAFAESMVTKAEERLGKARRAVLELQARDQELSPKESAETVLSVRAQLEGELAKARAELGSLESVMTAQHPKVVAMRQKVGALQRQIDKQKKRLVNERGESIGSAIAEFEPVMFEKEVAERAFETALRSVEMARMEVIREQRYLVTISPPSMPGQSTYPRRFWGVLTIFVLSIVLLGVVSMLAAAVREHAKF